MENSVKKSVVVEIPRRKSLDIKSLYKSSVSDVGENKNKQKISDENENGGEDLKKKKRKNGKEILLSNLESDAKKSRKEHVNGTKSESDFSLKASGGSKLNLEASLALGNNGNTFNIPKRPRGPMRRKKVKIGQVSDPLQLSKPNDLKDALSKSDANKSDANTSDANKSEKDEDRLSDGLVRLLSLSAGNNSSSHSKSATDSKSNLNKMGDLKPMGKADQSTKRQGKSRKKKDSVSIRDIEKTSIKISDPSDGNDISSNSKSAVDSKLNLNKKVDSKPTVNVDRSKKGQGKSRKKKDSVFINDGEESSMKNSEPCAGASLQENDGDGLSRLVSLSAGNDSCSNSKPAADTKLDLNKKVDSKPMCEIDQSTKRQGKSRKKKDSVSIRDGEKTSMKKSEPSVVNSLSDDEENLEENAAMMLSSRFDPACTGFSTKRKYDESEMANGFSFPVSSSRDSFNQQANSSEDKCKVVTKKRRHFYEIPTKDFDPHWVLNKRIKVYWPFEESWHAGLVTDYHPECKVHHIKYDERDEEWIDLQEEKFKLLLLASEVPNKVKRNKGSKRGKRVPPSDDGTRDDGLESETIASWLTRSSQHVPKSSKKRKTSKYHLLPVKTENSNSNIDDSEKASDKADCEENSTSTFPQSKLLVYVRQRNRKIFKEGGSLFQYVNARGSAVDNNGDLRLNSMWFLSEKLTFRISEPFLACPLRTGDVWLCRNIIMLQYWVLAITSPAVVLEILFVDSKIGLKIFLLEGFLNQVLAFLFRILIIFRRYGGRWTENIQLPVKSIRFGLSSAGYSRKQHVFAFYSLCGMRDSKWVDLESKLMRNFRLAKELSVTDCTYDNIKATEKLVPTILPMGVHSFASGNLQNHNSICSQESSENSDQQLPEKPILCNPSPINPKHNLHEVQIGTLEESTYEIFKESNENKNTPKLIADQSLANGISHSPNKTGPATSWKRGRISSFSSPLKETNYMLNGFSNGPKKPRTQVRYTVPSDFNAKQKRIRRPTQKRLLSNGFNTNHKKDYEPLPCVANILITEGDKGWRECGAHIVLESSDHNEWKLSVKIFGTTKYQYKVKHALQAGSTNRYSHAMLWRGGNDWLLEFPDRNEWALFKEMHEECYNRNIRVKNIPIPGVWEIEEKDGYTPEVPFFRNFARYYRQVQGDVEMAMDPSRVLYDMDSDDERWLVENNNRKGVDKFEEISDEFFEKIMDVFEKVSYVRGLENFTDTEIEELVIGRGPMEAAKIVYGYWRKKRETKGMPLVRHLQPPLWETYQQQLKKWENTVSRPEKPPMFAFCQKPRGLDVPNKGLKQRSQRKISVSRDQNNVLGRRSNGRSTRASVRNRNPKVNKYHQRKSQPVNNQRTTGSSEPSDQRSWAEKLDGSDLQEFHFREALRAAEHAKKVAKEKREKAQRLFCKADFAVHKAAVALMNAEAMKSAYENLNGNNQNRGAIGNI